MLEEGGIAPKKAFVEEAEIGWKYAKMGVNPPVENLAG